VHNICVGTPGGDIVVVPDGATGPFPTKNGLGIQYQNGSGGPGLDARTTGLRIMEPTAPSGPSPGYPNGYTSYNNITGQTVDPYTGEPVAKVNPIWHIPLK
jgi:hypothetical protein